MSGLEYQYNKALAGRSGTETEQQSPSGVPLPGTTHETNVVAGTGLELTLDESLQYVTEQSLSAAVASSHAKSGIAVVMNVHSGDILAMANVVQSPTTNAVTQAPPELRLDPGVRAGIGVQSGHVLRRCCRPASSPRPRCSRCPTPSPSTAGCSMTPRHIRPSNCRATQILAQSSNIGTIEIAERLGEQRLADQIAALGFRSPDAESDSRASRPAW